MTADEMSFIEGRRYPFNMQTRESAKPYIS